MKKTNNYAITSGNFSSNGNFSGYTALGERLFIHKSQMTALGWTKAEDVKFPFYAIGGTREFNKLDENQQPVLKDGVPVMFDRLQALSVYPKISDLQGAHVDVATLDISIAGAIKTAITAAGLSEKDMLALENASV